MVLLTKMKDKEIAAVFQDPKSCFDSNPFNPNQCIHVLMKVIYLVNESKNKKMTVEQAEYDLSVATRLYRSRDIMLHRHVFDLSMEELSTVASAEIIVTSWLTKDMTGKIDFLKPSAIPALVNITESSTRLAIERYMKQAVVDKNPDASSAALVSALHMAEIDPGLLRRWVDESREAITLDKVMKSYQTLAVEATTRRNDLFAAVNLFMKFNTGWLQHSHYALCLLIRHVAYLAKAAPTYGRFESYMRFIQLGLSHKLSVTVVYEAAHAIINLRSSEADLAPVMSVLQSFCYSKNDALRLAGVQTLARLAIKHPNLGAECSADFENLIKDPNRDIATFAVITLLDIGPQSSIDGLVAQVRDFLPDISDDFKILVVGAIGRVCTKYPRKCHGLASHLSKMLRVESTVEYRTAIAEVLIALVEDNPDAKEIGLYYLYLYIGECNDSELTARILHVLRLECPKTHDPSRYNKKSR